MRRYNTTPLFQEVEDDSDDEDEDEYEYGCVMGCLFTPDFEVVREFEGEMRYGRWGDGR